MEQLTCSKLKCPKCNESVTVSDYGHCGNLVDECLCGYEYTDMDFMRMVTILMEELNKVVSENKRLADGIVTVCENNPNLSEVE